MNNKRAKIGTLISLDIRQVTGLLFTMGLDFMFVDLEHSNISDATILSLVGARQTNCQVLIRITEISETSIRHALDLGCDGIIAPRVECTEEVEILIECAYYPPNGKRSIGLVPANNYGLKFKEYIESFNPLLFPQIESAKGVELAERILVNPYVAGTFIGPFDLSVSLGIPGKFDSPLFINAVEAVRDLCKKYGKIFGTFTSDPQAAVEEIKKGADRIVVGSDANLLLHTYLQIINKLKCG
ncbi:HpcH/HpaI aldolase/citrate lyase family protein [Mucilaginibacter sp. L3T2-6]|uniref:HpcH/HpaI aldolase family protein n=1 Tax=Mucilaginibacter sp. L3T2-6 TaxID=3062491 RepID=UPI002675FF9F|nr:aldolase/citrate lyase family protein [Mucilaginibacter sp. L3T2-6]MDO3641453.1 aldolase/citrate lyase family protein [Mucilaginibacter sp. L3T2-6]MDV6213786.1 aldolase/citrate lyase family protein [Mucilaginibacter sp. L3T2-6]